jgi:hypothetical protein
VAACGAVVAWCVAALVGTARSEDEIAYVKSGAWELGLNAAVLAREGAVTTTLSLFSNRFWVRGGIPLSAGASAAFSRVSDLDRVDLEAMLAVYKQLPGSSAYGYAGIAGGLSQEWVGSFSQVRYPLGLDVGIKAFVSRRAALTVAYKFRRLLNDPVADFSEHRFVAGFSIMFNNGRDDPQ